MKPRSPIVEEALAFVFGSSAPARPQYGGYGPPPGMYWRTNTLLKQLIHKITIEKNNQEIFQDTVWQKGLSASSSSVSDLAGEG
jgi:hypothetical protein